MRRLLLLVLLLAPAPLHAWGSLAHRLTARLALDYVSSDARREIARLLGTSDLASVANWADSVRDTGGGSGPPHFINLPVDSAAGDWLRFCPASGCILSAIERYSGILADRRRSDPERAEALRFLVHLVSDVHQPMHVGDRGDRGGNDLPVIWRGERVTLHRVWDLYLVGSARRNENDRLGRLRRVARQMDRKGVASGEAADWAAESHALARDHAYVVPPYPADLHGRYSADNLPRAEARLARAGIRLGALLDRLLVTPGR